MDDRETHYESVETRARAARLAILLNLSDPDWRSTALRIIELLSSSWGGKHSLIIPTDGSYLAPAFWSMLEKFSPDYIYVYRKTGSDLQMNRPDQYEELVLANARETYGPSPTHEQVKHVDKHLRRSYADQMRIEGSLQSEIIRRVVPFHFKGHIYPATANTELKSATDMSDVILSRKCLTSFLSLAVPQDIEPIWWAATLGRYSAQFAAKLKLAAIPERKEELSEQNVKSLAHAIVEGTWHTRGISPEPETPFEISMSGLSYYGTATELLNNEKQVVLVWGDTLSDFALSYCLNRIGLRAVWMPTACIQQLESDSLQAGLMRSVLYEMSPSSETCIKSCSISLDLEQQPALLDSVRSYIGFGVSAEDPTVCEDPAVLATQARNALTPYCTDTLNHRELYPFKNNQSIGPIRTPQPTGFAKLSTLKHRWIAEIRVDGRSVPTVPEIAPELLRIPAAVGSLEARVSKNSLVYACPGANLIVSEDIASHLRHPRIQLFDTFAGISKIAAASGFKCELSDKGIYQRDSLRKFGGINKAAELLQGPAGRLLLKYLDHDKRKPGVHDEGCVLHGDKRTYLDLNSAQKATAVDEESAAALLDQFCELEILVRGFVLGCRVCGNVDWYALSRVSNKYTCQRCGREQTMVRESWRYPASPQVFYKLDELVYQFLSHEGRVVALGLDYMSRCSNLPFEFSPELKYWNSQGTTNGEIDICAVWDGELTIGEAKKDGRLAKNSTEEKKIIGKYVSSAFLLHARRVVFCTTSAEWSAATVQAVREAFASHLARPIFLTAESLSREMRR